MKVADGRVVAISVVPVDITQRNYPAKPFDVAKVAALIRANLDRRRSASRSSATLPTGGPGA